MNPCNLNFHQTFKPEKKYISSILEIAENNFPLSVQDISSVTGIPNGKISGKVEPHIMYSQYMGLIDAEKTKGLYLLKRTKVGEVVFNEDPGIQENLTLLLCHAMMLRKTLGASMWYSVFNKVFPLYGKSVNKNTVLNELNLLFDSQVNQKNFSPFLCSYEDMFKELNLIKIDSDTIEVNESDVNRDYIYLYALALNEIWDDIFSEQNEISSVQFKCLNFKQIFCLNEDKEFEILEQLVAKDIIRLNKQLSPYTVRRLIDKDILINKLYSELC